MDIVERIAAIAKMAAAIDDHVIYDQLGDLRIEAYELKMKLLELREENRQLKERLADKGKVKFENQACYVDGEGPYCSNCYDAESLKIHMLERDQGYGISYYRCPKCGNEIIKEKYHAELPDGSTAVPSWDR